MAELTRQELIQKIIEQDAFNKKLKQEVYKKNFYRFNKEIMSWSDLYEPLHKKVCDFIQDNIEKRMILLLMPRGSFKSSVVTSAFPLWQIAKNPATRGIIANATYPMATQFLGQVKDTLQKNDKFIDIYGDMATDAPIWREDAFAVNSDDSFRTKEPTVSAIGVGSNYTGKHVDWAILDDLVVRDNIRTMDRIQEVINFYKDILDLVDPSPAGHKRVIVIGTTWHESDLYSWIQDKETGIIGDFAVLKLPAYGHFEVNEAGKEVFAGQWGEGELLFPTRLTWSVLENLKRNQGAAHFCTPGESPITMADFSTKRIEDIVEGDMVLGWSEGMGQKAALKPSKVKAVFKYEDAEVVKIITDTGKTAKCTKEHKWFTGRGFADATHPRYKPAKIGSKLQLIVDNTAVELTEAQKQYALWLGGIFDGEGSCTESIFLHQDNLHNALVCEEMEHRLDALGFEWTHYNKTYDTTDKRYRNKNMYWIRGGKQAKIDFLRLCKPVKGHKIVKSLYKQGGCFVQAEEKVTNIRSTGRETVYALETETGNYVVWGFGSSNSAQYLLDPVPPDDAEFKNIKYYETDDIKGLKLNKFVALDPAFGEKAENDYSAMICVGVDPKNSWYILDIWRDKVNPKALIDKILEWDYIHKPHTFAIESTAFQRVIQYYLQDEMRKQRHNIPIKELTHTTRSKEDRIRALGPFYGRGTVFHNRHQPLNMYLDDELRRFPRGKNDDLIDALASIVEVAFPPKTMQVRSWFGKGGSYPA